MSTSKISRVSPADVEIGKRLKALRISAKLSQSKLAQFANISYQQIQKYEAGQNKISASKLMAFSKVLNVPISTFFEGDLSSGMHPSIEDVNPLWQSLPDGKIRVNLYELMNSIKEATSRS